MTLNRAGPQTLSVGDSSGHSATLTLVSYTAPGSSFDATKASLQTVYQFATGTFTPRPTNSVKRASLKRSASFLHAPACSSMSCN